MLATQLLLERRYDEAARKVEELLAAPEEPDEADRATTKEWLGSIRLYAGDIHGAEKIYLEAKPALEKLLQEQPSNRWLVGSLSTVEAGLGNKAAALAIAQKGLQVAVASGDPINAPFLEENLASGRSDQPDRAAADSSIRCLPAYGGAAAERSELGSIAFASTLQGAPGRTGTEDGVSIK